MHPPCADWGLDRPFLHWPPRPNAGRDSATHSSRCEAYSTVDCQWKVASKFTQNFATRVGIDPFGDAREQAVSDKRLPATLVWTASFQSAGPKLRLSDNQPSWGRELIFRKLPRILVSDGTESRSIRVTNSQTRSGLWTKAQNPRNVGFDQHLTPILTQFQASRYPIASLFDPEVTKAVIEKATWDGHQCVLLRWDHPRQQPGGRELSKYALWLDPAADYSVRRFITTRRGVIEFDIRIRLAEQDGLWVPKQWKWSDYHHPQGKLMAVHFAEMVDVRLNKPVDDSLFELPFPRGTLVSDQRERLDRELLIGSEERVYEVTSQQRAKAGSLEVLLEELERD